MNTDPEFTERKFEDELRELLNSDHLESPSPDFKKQVMAKVRVEKKQQSYQPVISKVGWLIVAFFIFAVAVFALLKPMASSTTPAWISEVSGFLNTSQLDIGLWGYITGFFNSLHLSGLLIPLTGLFLAMAFHGLVMKQFYFSKKKKVSGTFLF